MLMLAGFPLAFGLLVFEFPKIGDPTNGRSGVGCHLHQIHARLLRQTQRLAGGHDTELLSVTADHADFTGANLLIYTNKLLNE